MKTLKKLRFKKLLIAFAGLIFFISCKDNPRPEPEFREEYVEEEIVETIQEGDVIETIEGVTEISHFAMALGVSDFETSTAATKSYTIFAPVNDAFPPWESSPDSDPSTFDRSEVVFYHIIQDDYSVEELQQIATSDTMPYIDTMKGEKIYLSMDDNRIILTGNSGQKAEITRSMEASNGVVHIINNAFIPEEESPE